MALYNPTSNTFNNNNHIEQIYLNGSSVTVNNDITLLCINPAATIANLTITLTENPIDGQEIKLSFGGSITTGIVITNLTIQGNTGQTILNPATISTSPIVGEGYIFKYQALTNLWRLF